MVDSAGGVPEERPSAAAEAEQRAPAEEIAVSSTERLVAHTRGKTLLAGQDAAAQRLSAAQAALWTAEQTGDHNSIDTARAQVAAAQTDFTRVTDEAIKEMLGISQTETTG
ncbi:hypothetical protein [Amycolatopsis sp. NPDC051061]|uniref:hypothetical protein n=1 Tax=Amycolatopsis sp. NPDC051061 TaxID=3155042 RepID=UPI003430973F